MVHSILFTGHMIDKPGRAEPRFPPARERAAAEAIRNALRRVQAQAQAAGAAVGAGQLKGVAVAAGTVGLRGVAAAACGGDILFHEACLVLGIPSELYLGIPVESFQQTSVAFAGPDWIARYQYLTKQLPVHVLLPNETAEAGDSVWEQANQWMLDEVLAGGGANMTLIALWDGQKGDGRGGVEHMVRVAKDCQAVVDIIDVHAL